MVNFKEIYLFQGSRGGPTFSRGVQLFLGGSNCLFPIETHITCDFPGGGPDPLSPSGSALASYSGYNADPRVVQYHILKQVGQLRFGDLLA